MPTKVNEKIKEYRLSNTCNKENPIPCNNDLADRFWQAGLDLSLDLGMLCTTSDRIMKFTDDEIKYVLKELPEKVYYGKDIDSLIIQKRDFCDNKPPIAYLGPFE